MLFNINKCYLTFNVNLHNILNVIVISINMLISIINANYKFQSSINVNFSNNAKLAY